MKLLSSVGMGVAGAAIAAMILAFAAPKTVHAMVAALVRNVDNPGRATIVVTGCSAISSVSEGLSGNTGCRASYEVPEGQRLVIEQIEASCQTPVGSYFSPVSFGHQRDTDLFATSHTLSMSSSSTPSAVFYHLNAPVRYYAEPLSHLSFFTVTSDGTGSSSCTFQLDGYLISYP